MPQASPVKTFGPLALLVVAAAAYLAFLPNYYVGEFGDDAVYVEAALSLLQGRYVSLSHPDTPPLIQFPPGYPLFLIPFVKMASGHWAILKITSMCLMLLNV